MEVLPLNSFEPIFLQGPEFHATQTVFTFAYSAKSMREGCCENSSSTGILDVVLYNAVSSNVRVLTALQIYTFLADSK